jgi:hypothetical protein
MYKAKKNLSVNLQKYVHAGIFSVILLMVSGHLQAQEKDTITAKKEKVLKNTIKINLTSFVLYNGFQLNYERILSKKSSITVWGGPVQFPMPTIIANSSLNLDKNKVKSGYTFGADYRFYLASENKYAAPHGVYLAPYFSFYHFNNQRTGRDTANGNAIGLSTTMDFLNLGAQLGYQFVIKNRFVIDCVLLGPAVSSYYFSLQLKGDLSGDHNENVQKILEALKDKYPLFKDLANGGKISTSGISNFWSVGFRYAIHIGYRF